MEERLENFYIDKIKVELTQIKKKRFSFEEIQKVIKDIPEDVLTEKVCLFLIDISDGYILEFIPDKAKTQLVSSKALEKNGYNIKHYPSQFLTFDLCVNLIKEKRSTDIYNNNIDNIIRNIPLEFKNDNLWNILAEQGYLRNIPEDKRTIELCLTSIKKSILCAPFIPQELLKKSLPEITEEICLEIIKYSLQYVPREILITDFGKELCLESVKLHSNNLEYIPLEVLTKEMIIQAIYTSYRKQNGRGVLKYIKKISPNGEWFTEEICLALVDTYYSLFHIPEEKRTFDLCMTSVKKNDKDIELIPEEFKNDQVKMMILYTTMAESGHLQNIPKEILKSNNSNEVYKRYIMKGYSLKNIPLLDRDEELCLLAVQQCGLYLAYVPSDKKTTKICITALKQNKKSFQFLSQSLQGEIIDNYLEKH